SPPVRPAVERTGARRAKVRAQEFLSVRLMSQKQHGRCWDPMTALPQMHRALHSRGTRGVVAIAAALAMAGGATPAAAAGRQARLRHTADGWALVSPGGSVLFEAGGLDA